MNHGKSYSMGFLLLMASSAALAHPGHAGSFAGSFMDGVTHPLSGIDHMLAMFAVGVWAAQAGGRMMWLVPISFLSVMSLAGWMGASGAALPMIESGIATSVLLLGLLTAFSIRVAPTFGIGLVALFAVFHGYAHGVEMQGAVMWQYGLGFILTTALFHGAGLMFGSRLKSQTLWLRAAGIGVAMCGAWMLAFA